MSKRQTRHQTRREFVASHQHNKPPVPKVIIRGGECIPWEVYHGSTLEMIDQHFRNGEFYDTILKAWTKRETHEQAPHATTNA